MKRNHKRHQQRDARDQGPGQMNQSCIPTGLRTIPEKPAVGCRSCAVAVGFDFTQSDLPLKVSFPVMMSNIINWLNPHKLEFSILQTRAGEPFEIFLNPNTENFYTRAPQEKWEKHQATVNPYRFTHTQKVGIYTISENDKQRYFTVNLADESESNITRNIIDQLPEESSGPPVSEEISVQHPLWTVFLLFVCAVMMIEWFLWLKMG